LSSRRGKAEDLRLAIESSPRRPGFSTRRPLRGINSNAPHLRQVDYEATIAGRITRDIVTAATHRHQKIVRAREIHGVDDVGDPATANDQGRLLIDHSVPDLAGVVVTGFAEADQRTL
jgi:hypothetical protein